MKKGNTKQRSRALPTALNIINDSFMEKWTMQRVKKDAKRLRASIPKVSELQNDLHRALLDVIHDIESAEATLESLCHANLSFGEVYKEAQAAMQKAFQAGTKFMALKSRYEYPTGKGKTEDPAWPFIRRVWKESCKKIGHKEAVRDGVADYRKATGDNREINESSLVSRFKQMIGR